MFELMSQVIWLSIILGFQIVDSISKLLRIYYDNSIAMFLAKNSKSGDCIKHINIKCLAIREHIKSSNVVIERISTRLMIVMDKKITT